MKPRSIKKLKNKIKEDIVLTHLVGIHRCGKYTK